MGYEDTITPLWMETLIKAICPRAHRESVSKSGPELRSPEAHFTRPFFPTLTTLHKNNTNVSLQLCMIYHEACCKKSVSNQVWWLRVLLQNGSTPFLTPQTVIFTKKVIKDWMLEKSKYECNQGRVSMSKVLKLIFMLHWLQLDLSMSASQIRREQFPHFIMHYLLSCICGLTIKKHIYFIAIQSLQQGIYEIFWGLFHYLTILWANFAFTPPEPVEVRY